VGGKGSGAHGGLEGGRNQRRKVQRWRFDGGPSRRGEIPRRRWCSGSRSVGRRRESGQEAPKRRCSAGGELGEGQEGAERRDDGEKGLRRRFGGGAEPRRSRGAKMRVHERIKEVEEGSWMCCGTKKRHGRDGVAAGG
jgi:hypothetical protein